MAKTPPKKPKDPAKPTRAKAAREHMPRMAPEIEQLLNPAIAKGTAGIGSGTGFTSPQRGEVDRAQRGRVRGNESGGVSPSPAPSARPLPSGERLGEALTPTQKELSSDAARGLQPPASNSKDRRAANAARPSG